jgi:hypothetical protein
VELMKKQGIIPGIKTDKVRAACSEQPWELLVAATVCHWAVCIHLQRR